MTPDRLAEARAADAAIDLTMPHPFPTRVYAHRRELLAEVDRLTDELDALNASSDRAASREIDLRTEVDRLTRQLAEARDDADFTQALANMQQLTAERDQARGTARRIWRGETHRGSEPGWLTAEHPLAAEQQPPAGRPAVTATPATPATTDSQED